MYTYIVKCVDGTLYTGIATDIKRRMSEHLGAVKGGAKYTKSRPPTYVCAVWKSAGKSEAMKLEYFIKKLTRSQKIELLSSFDLSCFGEKISADDYTLCREFIGDVNSLL